MTSTGCPACQHQNRRTARFCEACGTRLDAVLPPATAAERTVELRQATFLFCDLVQSTRLANQLALEDLRLVFRSFREVVAQATRQHNGFLMRFVGDGAFLSFGYPEAREDAADSAVRAGLDLVRQMRAAKPVPGVALELRIGIASGTVVVGEVIDESAVKEESVIGSVPHLAARLVAEAPPGGIAIADTTRRLAGRFFDYIDLGVLTLKGFDDGVRAWLVRGESSIASRFEARESVDNAAGFEGERDSELVGRADTVARLAAAWSEAKTGRGQTWVLSGEAGVGKSRLARASLKVALADGGERIELDCSARTRHTPLYPVSVLARRIAGIQPDDDAARRSERARVLLGRLLGSERVDDALGYLAPLFGVSAAVPPVAASPERIRERSIALLVEIVRGMAAARPLLLLCEDMHWADPTTAALAQQIASQIGDLPVLFIVTTRLGEADANLDLAGAQTLAIAPLDRAAAEAVVRRVAGDEPFSQAVIDGIVRRGEGVPLFLEELTRNLIEAAQSGASAATDGAALKGIPATLQSVVQVRLDRWPGLKPIIQAASVLGREFSLRLLEEMHDDKRSELFDAIGRLVDRGVIAQREGSSPAYFRFRHALIHEAVYDTLLRGDRERLHSRAAEVLVQHFDGMPEAAQDVLAQHLAAARRYDEAVRCLLTAAAETAARAAYLESIDHCRAGLALVDKMSEARAAQQAKLRLLTQLGVGLAATRGYAAPEVEATYQQARALCDDDADPVALFPIVRGLGTFYFVRADFANADLVGARCLELAQQSGQPDLLIEAKSFAGYTRLYLGHIDAARQALDEAVALYQAHDGQRFRYPSAQDAGTAAWSLLGLACWLQGDTLAAEEAVRDALAHADRLNRPFDKAYAHVWVAMLRNMQRRHEDASQHAAACTAICSMHGFSNWLAVATMHDCIASAARAAKQDAIDLLRYAQGAFVQAGAEANLPFFLWGTARGLLQMGKADEAKAAVADAHARGASTGEVFFRSELLLLEAELAEADADTDADRRAIALRQAAYDFASERGAQLLALRAALGLIQTTPGGLTPAQQAMLQALDSGGPLPQTGDWVARALADLQPALARIAASMAAAATTAA